ncbi:MAG: sugar phosphate isomerase/epimerase family protein, partial [Planctomycetota bacterium]
MRIGYNTNGLAHHSLPSAIDLLAGFGYRSVAITLDHTSLNPYSADFAKCLRTIRRQLDRRGLRSVVETGARYLLDPKHKHEPTMVSLRGEQRQRRVDFLQHAVDAANELGSDCVSLWSGAVHDDAAEEEAICRLIESLEQVVKYAERKQTPIGFEPEPGMLIDSMKAFERLLGQIDSPQLGLTIDVGHL